jgi:MarR family transcriptional regulator, organic hydroperoxide resistance regulator
MKKNEPTDYSLGYKIWVISNVWQKKLAIALDNLGLTYTQFILLAGLFYFQENGEETTQTKLADKTDTDVMMTSQVLRKMESKGLIKRKNHEHDSRAKKIFLTKKGLDIITDAYKLVEGVDKDFFTSTLKDSSKFTQALTSIKLEL